MHVSCNLLICIPKNQHFDDSVVLAEKFDVSDAVKFPIPAKTAEFCALQFLPRIGNEDVEMVRIERERREEKGFWRERERERERERG
jgi:hypothetical protein